MALVNAFGEIALDQSVQDVKDILETGARVNPENITTKFREAFESFSPGTRWNVSQDSGDIVQLDGNAIGSSYLVISKDPLTTGGVTTIETIQEFDMPIESAVGFSLSQRAIGQEFAMEFVSTETPLTPPSEIPISSITQATTTLTVNTSSPHNIPIGTRIGIYGVSDSRLNYPSLVVATIPSPTQFTCTAGPGSSIASVNAGPLTNTGTIYFRSALGYAQNGVSQIWENATATQSSVYQRASAGDVYPSGTVNGNHSITNASTAGTNPLLLPFTYSWFPTNEFRINLQADNLVYYDVAVDATTITTARAYRTQILPDPTKKYKLRFRFTNNKGLTIPTAKIVSATKTASTTATIVTDVAHGLTTGDFIIIYGIRDQTNFANLTTATAVASVVSPTSFTIAFGANATATSYGGMVARVQGGNIPTTLTSAHVIQSAANDGTFLTLVGTGTWSWNIGDYINVYGARDNVSGADMNIDGAYKVANISTTTMILQPIGNTTLPATFTTTNCGGYTIRRVDARISFVRIFDFIRERVEILSQPTIAKSVPVAVTNTAAISGSVTQSTPNTWINAWPVTIMGINGPDINYQSIQAFDYVRSRIAVA